MPLDIIVTPLYPDVPLVLGVPPLPRLAGFILAAEVAVLADALGLSGLFAAQVWGLFGIEGDPVIVADTISDVEFRQDRRISTAPQEEGAFMSYNKVAEPFQGRVGFVQAGTIDDRNFFLEQIERAEASLDLFDLVMPEKVYPSVNVVHHDFRRSARRGMSMLMVDVWVEEVRVTGTAAYSSTATPNGSSTVNGGNVQAQTAPASMVPTRVQNGVPVGAVS